MSSSASPRARRSPSAQSLLKGMTPDEVTLDKALALLSLPRELGPHPEDGEPILAGVGRFGPYVKHGAKYKSIPADESVLDIGMNRAVALLAEAKSVGRGRAAEAAARGRQPSRRRGADRALRRPLRPLREAWRHQRHRAARPQAGGADARPGGVAAGRARGEGRRQEAGTRQEGAEGESQRRGRAGRPTTWPTTRQRRPKAAKKKAAPKRKAAKAKTESPPRTGTDG